MKANDLVLRVVNEIEEGKFEIKEFKPHMEYESFISCILADAEILRPTGLKDRNGKDIYEGDIVKTHEGYLMKVIWNDSGFKLMFKFKRTYQGEEYWETRKDISLNGSDDKRWGCEVVGNIYENPTLLEH